MRKSRAGSLNGVIGCGSLRITLSIPRNYYSTKLKKQGGKFPPGYSAKVSVGCIQFSRLPAKPFESGHYVIRPKQPAWLAHVWVSSRGLSVSSGDVQRC